MLTASDLMRQASDTAANYMSAAVREVNECFGKDWVHTHPVEAAPYIQALMLAAALDFHACFTSRQFEAIGEALSGIGDAVVDLAESLDQFSGKL